MSKVVLITGASSGIGMASLKKLVAIGHIVYGTGRKNQDLKNIKNAGAIPLKLELTKEKDIKNAVNIIIKEHGRIDVLFNNAGYGLYGTVEEVPISEARKQFEVNLFSLARLTQLVLPHMRKQKAGLIINTSSIGGRVYSPLGAWYHATKHALEGWSDCLRIETSQFGIKVVVIEPGIIKTPWGKTAAENLLKYSGKGPYKKLANIAASATKKRYESNSNISDPSIVADAVVKAIQNKNPKTRYAVGKYSYMIKVRKILSDKMFDKILLGLAKK